MQRINSVENFHGQDSMVRHPKQFESFKIKNQKQPVYEDEIYSQQKSYILNPLQWRGAPSQKFLQKDRNDQLISKQISRNMDSHRSRIAKTQIKSNEQHISRTFQNTLREDYDAYQSVNSLKDKRPSMVNQSPQHMKLHQNISSQNFDYMPQSRGLTIEPTFSNSNQNLQQPRLVHKQQSMQEILSHNHSSIQQPQFLAHQSTGQSQPRVSRVDQYKMKLQGSRVTQEDFQGRKEFIIH